VDSPKRPAAGPAAEVFSPERLNEARAQERPVFVNMTVAWCITCLVNERIALSSRRVAQAFDAAKKLYLKGDWTNRDPEITDYLDGLGRSGVPIYVLYPPNAASAKRLLGQGLFVVECDFLRAREAGSRDPEGSRPVDGRTLRLSRGRTGAQSNTSEGAREGNADLFAFPRHMDVPAYSTLVWR